MLVVVVVCFYFCLFLFCFVLFCFVVFTESCNNCRLFVVVAVIFLSEHNNPHLQYAERDTCSN